MIGRLLRRARQALADDDAPHDPFILAMQMQEAQELLVEQIIARELAPLVKRIERLEAEQERERTA
jgi:hypothetical protein